MTLGISPSSRILYATRLRDSGMAGQSHSVAHWARVATLGSGKGALATSIRDFLTLLEFDKSPKPNAPGFDWTLSPAALARINLIIDSSPPPPPAAPKLEDLAKAKATQRSILHCSDQWTALAIPSTASVKSLPAQYKFSDYKNCCTTLEAVGAIVKTTMPDRSPGYALTALGRDLTSSDKPTRMAALRRAHDSYTPHALLDRLMLRTPTREACIKELISKGKWSQDTAAKVLSSYAKNRQELGLDTAFAGQAKHDKVGRRAKLAPLASPATIASHAPATARAQHMEDLESCCKIFSLSIRTYLIGAAQHAYSQLFGSASFNSRKSTEEALLKAFGTGISADLAARGLPLVSERSLAREALRAFQTHGWLQSEMDYSLHAEVWTPTAQGKILFHAIHQASRPPSSMGTSFGSFRHCARALEEFIENPSEFSHLLEAMRASEDVNNDLADEARRLSRNCTELIDSYESNEAFDRISASLGARLLRNEKQLLSHGAETHWGKIQTLLASLETLNPHDPRLAGLPSEIDYVKGETGPWSASPRSAISWCSQQISIAMDIAKNVRSQEVFAEIQNYSKLSHALIRARSTRSKTLAALKAIQQLCSLDPQQSESACQHAIGLVFHADPRMADPERLEFSIRKKRQFAPLVEPTPPTPWQTLFGDFKSKIDAKRPPSPHETLAWLTNLADGKPAKLSALLNGVPATPLSLCCAQIAEILCSLASSRLIARKLAARFRFGPIEREDLLIFPRALAVAMAEPQHAHPRSIQPGALKTIKA